ncbi:MAG: amidase [Woeseiaceae bacterium]
MISMKRSLVVLSFSAPLLLASCAVPVGERATSQDAASHSIVAGIESMLMRICEIDGQPAGVDCDVEADAMARNSVLEVNPDIMALATTLAQTSEPQGRLHGIPVMLKANIETADQMTTTAGAHAMAGFQAKADATLVERLRASGALIAGKTNLSEWANFRSNDSISGWSGLGGQTRHALDPTRNPCGSSSGSAVAVALGIVPLAIGTETDGSIVCPASINGIVGIKPTLGLVSRSGIIPLAHSQDTAGPMAKTVKEAALLLEVIAGHDVDDAMTKLIPDDALPLDYALDTNALRGKRIGVLRSFYGSGEYDGVEQTYQAALQRLVAAGAELVDPIEIETEGMGDAEYAVLLYEFKADLNAYLATRDAPVANLAEIIAFNAANAGKTMPFFGQDILLAAEATSDLSSTDYRDALVLSKKVATEGLQGAFEGHDLDFIVAPTNGPAWKIDYEAGDRFTVGSSSLAAVSGFPSITVPAGQTDGLPLGLSFIGKPWQDARLIEAAFAFEQTKPATQE